MHEMALCESVLKILEEEAVKQRFDQVKSVWLEVGRLSHVEPEAMRFCFEAVTKGTLADGARLEILRPGGEAWCIDCGRAVAIDSRIDACPECGGYRLQVTGGEDMKIKELEVA
jgi:hydrogenase nickel incorporation protein HypA/HybF